MGLVRAIAVRFLYSGTDYEDLCQIGCLGLVKAIRNFDFSKGVMFSTYAVPVIIGEIRKFLRDDGPVKVSRSIREQYIKIQRAEQALSLIHIFMNNMTVTALSLPIFFIKLHPV